jgi:hypothetical protein
MDAELRARRREQPTRPRSEHPGRRAPGSTRARPYSLTGGVQVHLVPDSHHRGGATVVETPPVRFPLVSLRPARRRRARRELTPQRPHARPRPAGGPGPRPGMPHDRNGG